MSRVFHIESLNDPIGKRRKSLILDYVLQMWYTVCIPYFFQRRVNMKKKIILVLTVAVVLLLSVLLAACSLLGGGNDNGGGGAKVTLESITVSMAENSRYAQYFENGEITLPAGTSANFSESDFVVKGKYSDNTNKSLSNFSIAVNRSDSNLIVIDFIVGDSVMLQLNVHTSFVSLPTIDTTTISIEYTGQPVNVLTRILQDDDVTVAEAIADGKYSLVNGSVTQATDAGSYSLQLKAPEGCVWVNDNLETDQIGITWEITKKVVTLPTVADNIRTFEYDGTEKTLNLDLHGFDDVLSFVDGGRDTRKGIDAGRYTCLAIIRNEARANYTFPGNHTSGEAMEVASFTITQKILPVPTISNMTVENGVYHCTYTGERILPVLTVGDTALSRTVDPDNGTIVYDADNAVYPENTVSIQMSSSDAEMTDALSGNFFLDNGEGYHVVTLSLYSDANYAWSGTADSQLTLKFVIDRADAALPDDFEEEFSLKYAYTGIADDIGGAWLQISPNNFLKLVDAGEMALTSGYFNSGFMMTEEVKTYLAENDIAIYENINLPMDDNYQPIGFLGNNNEFSWSVTSSFGDDNIADIGTYYFDLVYKKGISDSNQIENYNPVVKRIRVEVIKGGLSYAFTEPDVSLGEGIGAYFTPLDGAKPVYSTDENGNALTFSWVTDAIVTIPGTISQNRTVLYSATGLNGTYSVTNAISAAGYYKITFLANYDTEKYVAYYQKNTDQKYYVQNSFTYDWEVLKRDFAVQDGNLSTLDLTWAGEVY